MKTLEQIAKETLEQMPLGCSRYRHDIEPIILAALQQQEHEAQGVGEDSEECDMCKQLAEELSAEVLERAQDAREHEAQVARLTKERDNAREDVKRLDWLESASWEHPLSGNGIAIFPCQSAHTGQRYIHLHGLGEEDGSNLGEEITGSSPTLRAAITQAMTGGAE